MKLAHYVNEERNNCDLISLSLKQKNVDIIKIICTLEREKKY